MCSKSSLPFDMQHMLSQEQRCPVFWMRINFNVIELQHARDSSKLCDYNQQQRAAFDDNRQEYSSWNFGAEKCCLQLNYPIGVRHTFEFILVQREHH
jgi:hypothetical protein